MAVECYCDRCNVDMHRKNDGVFCKKCIEALEIEIEALNKELNDLHEFLKIQGTER